VTGRTDSTSSIHREVTQAQGHRGSNQKPAVTRSGIMVSDRADDDDCFTFNDRRQERFHSTIHPLVG
jgi:hypothetical protein